MWEKSRVSLCIVLGCQLTSAVSQGFRGIPDRDRTHELGCLWAFNARALSITSHLSHLFACRAWPVDPPDFLPAPCYTCICRLILQSKLRRLRPTSMRPVVASKLVGSIRGTPWQKKHPRLHHHYVILIYSDLVSQCFTMQPVIQFDLFCSQLNDYMIIYDRPGLGAALSLMVSYRVGS